MFCFQTRRTEATDLKANGYWMHASHRKDPASLATAKTATTEGTDPTMRTHQLPRRLDSDMYVGTLCFWSFSFYI